MTSLTEPERAALGAALGADILAGIRGSDEAPHLRPALEAILDQRIANAVRVTHHRCCEDGEQCRVHAPFLHPALRILGRLADLPTDTVHSPRIRVGRNESEAGK
jgi:hypothetical protein